MKRIVAVIVGLTVLPCLALEPANEEQTIRATMMARWDRPDTPLVIDTIARIDDTAVVSWEQGTEGGRAVLKKEGKSWNVVLCAGKAATEPDVLIEFTSSRDEARALADAIVSAEQGLSQAKRARFDSFARMVREAR